jgi:GT2 family glycosyltransferase
MSTELEPLVVIPNYITEKDDLKVLFDGIMSIHKTVPGQTKILVVDDFSPGQELVDEIERMQAGLEFTLIRRPENEGFSRTVNVGLQQALDEGRDAVLMNADIEIDTPGWVETFRQTQDSFGNPAAVVGALLLYPNGLIQHGGIYFSLLTRDFREMYKYGPGNLPAALKMAITPVTGAFQFIRHECLTSVGLYDPAFRMGHEDVDYCLRVFLSGERQCVYNPSVRAYHFESMFRGRPSPKIEEWQQKSWILLANKYANQNFSDLVPFV